MTPKRRAKEIETFRQIHRPSVCHDLKRQLSRYYINCGSHIVFMEPCEQEDIRKQAIGRVWRIGQTKPVSVTT